MNIAAPTLDALKARARNGDLEALQTLRDVGYFRSKSAAAGFPLSPAQRQLWLAAQRHEGVDPYVVALALRLHGPLRRPELVRALEALHARHETLRTTFGERDGQLLQFIGEPGELPLTEWDGADPEACRQYLEGEAARGFDLKNGPLWRTYLCRLSASDHVWAVLVHHLIADGWSLEVMQSELAALYEAHCRGDVDPLPPLTEQYRAFVDRHRRQVDERTNDAQEYWADKLSSPLPVLDLPTDRPRTGRASAAAAIRVHWEAAPVKALQQMGASYDATLFVVLEALVKVLLYRYTGQEDLIISTPVAVRDGIAEEKLVGLFINVVPLRDRIDPERGFGALLRNAGETMYGAFARREYPVHTLLDARSEGAAQTALTSVLVALQPVVRASVSVSDLEVIEFTIADAHAKSELAFEFIPDGEGLVLQLTYDAYLFARERMTQLCGHLRQLLEGVVAEPEGAVGTVALLTAVETARLAGWETGARPGYPREASVPAVWRAQVAARPTAVAVVEGTATLTYGGVAARAGRWAGRLRAAGVGRETRVGVYLERSTTAVVGLVAILEAGGTYVPLDPGDPPARVAAVVAAAGVTVVVTTADRAGAVPAGVAVCLEDGPAGAEAADGDGAEPTAEGLAYVMYTSGSTGTPKGVGVRHRGIVRLVCETDYLRLGPGDRVGQASTLTFDAATFEIWGPLLTGGTVVVLPAGAVLEAATLGATLRAAGITVLFVTTALFHRLAQAAPGVFGGLRALLFGGEAVEARWVRAVQAAGGPGQLLHVYGPTECTTFATWHAVGAVAATATTVPIGRPIAQTTAYVLDGRQQRVPVGVTGELYLGGDGVAAGYVDDAALTAARFVTHPVWGRLYRTGDQGRWTAAGTLAFFGRRDHQVKLRGFRVELGEIETVLRGAPGVTDAVVVVRGTDAGRALVAYAAGPAVAEGALTTYLAARLPPYLRPARVVGLAALPLTAHGKVDRAQLPAPAARAAGAAAPETPTEAVVAAIWGEVLGEAVGPTDDFFARGGHSLLAMQVVGRVRAALGVEVGVATLFAQPQLRAWAAGLDAAPRGAGAPIPVQPAGAAVAVSFAQQRLWALAAQAPGAGRAYGIHAAVTVTGALDVGALRTALRGLTARHQSLRLNLVAVDGTVEGRLRAPDDPLTVAQVAAGAVAARVAAAVQAPWDLAGGRLFAVTLLQTGEATAVLLVRLHHVIADGWSLAVVGQELSALYAAAQAGRAAELPPLPLQYGDYAAWQRAWVAGPAGAAARAYWQGQLAGAAPLLALPTDQPRPAVQDYAGAQAAQRLEAGLVAQVRAASQAAGVTLYMTLLTALAVLLQRVSGAAEVLIGSPVANRSRPELEGLVGLVVNTVVLRIPVTGAETGTALLATVRAVTLAAYAQQELPFEAMVEAAGPARSGSHSPLVQVLLAVQNAPAAALTLPGVRVTPYAAGLETGTAKADLCLSVTEEPGGTLAVGWEYRTALLTAATIARWQGYFAAVLTGLVTTPGAAVGTLPLLPAGEAATLAAWERGATPRYPRDATVAGLVAAQVAAHPGAVAVVDGAETLTYAALGVRATAWAGRLRAAGVGRETRVGVYLERSATAVVGLLAILEAGGTCVPLDPGDPPARVAAVLATAGVRVVVTTAAQAGAVPAGVAVCLEEGPPWIAVAGAGEAATADSLAYVIYTSGSTGTPKGVGVPHRGIVRLVCDTDYLRLGPGDRVGQASRLTFDAATFEIWGPLLTGGTVVVLPPGALLEAATLGATIAEAGITVLLVMTALFHRLAQAAPGVFGGLRALLFGGEAVEARWVRAVQAAGAPGQLLHLYGPTECTTFATWHSVGTVDPTATTVPIGRPIAQTMAYVLDGQQQRVPIGVAGELYLGGDGLAAGYVDDAGLTAARFGPVGAWGRLYRTGDQVRWTAAGTLEFLGRLDRQIKLRGFRIEPGEIEAALRADPAVRDAAVEVAGTDAHRQLVAYLAADAAAVPAVRARLAAALPAYLQPAVYVPLAALPLTANGKVDRAALPAPPPPAAAAVPPATPREATLAALWAAVLRVPVVGRTDNFFALGGDSILAIQIVARAQAHGLRCRVADLFTYQTIADLAPGMSEISEGTDYDVERGGEVPLTPIQRWFFSSHSEEPSHFNQSVLLRPRVALDEDALRRSLDAIAEQHASFCYRYERTPEGWVQRYGDPQDALPLQVEDLTHLPIDEQRRALEQRATTWQRSLDLTDGPLARVVLFRLSDGQRLLWTVHHLAVDAVSWRVLLGDLQSALAAAAQGDAPQLSSATAPFAAWAHYLQWHATTPQAASDQAYWTSLTDVDLPQDMPEGHPAHESTRQISVQLDRAETRAFLTGVHDAYTLRPNDVLLTALALALMEWTGARVFLVDVEGHGRTGGPDAPDVSRTVGWFTTIYPVRLELPSTADVGGSLKTIKESLRAVPSEGLTYGLLRYRETNPLPFLRPQIAFNYLGQFDQMVEDSLFAFADESAGDTHAPRRVRNRLFDVDAFVADGRLQVTWSYSRNQYHAQTVQSIADGFIRGLRAVIAHCQDPSTAGYTPSDFPLAALSQRQLDDLAIRHGRNVAAIYPLSPMQQGLVFHALHDGHDITYVEQLTCRLDGEIDSSRWRDAWTRLADRHPVLRTAVWPDVEPPLQIVHRTVPLAWEEEDWRRLDRDAQEQQQAYLTRERQRRFDLFTAPLIRLHLARLSERGWRLTFCFHHALLDGWSLLVLFEELFALVADREAPLPARPAYQRYIEWLQTQDPEEASAYWSATLADFSAPTALPLARPAGASAAGASSAQAFFSMDEESTNGLIQFAATERLTLATLLQAAWALVLHRYAGDTDIVYGVIASGRDIDLAGIDTMVGLFINTLPMRVKVDGTIPVATWLQDVQRRHQANTRHAYTPLGEIQRRSSVPAGTPLFESILVYENYRIEPRVGGGIADEFTVSDIRVVDRTNYPLAIIASTADAMSFRIGYDPARFDRDGIEQLFVRLRHVLIELTRSSDTTRVADVALFGDTEAAEIVDWSRRQEEGRAAETLVEMFDRAAARFADRTAVVCGDERLTYRELDRRAEALAVRLRRRRAGPDRIIALIAGRSVPLVVGILGIVKSGAAYLFIEPDMPPDRMAFMIADAGALAVVTETRSAPLLDHRFERIILGEDDADDIGVRDADGRHAGEALQPHHLAYVIYTSGSTGQPKGVMIAHANVTRLFAMTASALGFSPSDVWTLFHSCAFDFSVWELWGALLYGGRLVVVQSEVARDPVSFYDLLEQERVTVLNQTPSAFRQLIPIAERRRTLTSLRLVIFGGETLDLPALKPWFDAYGDTTPELVNMYGITETTVHVTWRRVRIADTVSTASLIGRPLPDLSLWLLDADARPVPVGAVGEMYVGGAGLARGYLNRPDLTRERFVEIDVFGRRERLYRSGDLARRRPDGTLEYIGRADHQVKIRGYRIELGEIESVLSDHPDVGEAVVMSVGAGDTRRLAAYVSTKRPVAEGQLQAWLGQRLPDHMVPTHMMEVRSLPLTANGKVDRRALTDLLLESRPVDANVAPRDDIDRRVAAIWAQALQCDNPGIDDSLFALGGHSLTAMQIAARIYHAFGVKVPLPRLFRTPTIAGLASLVREARTGTYARIPLAAPLPDYPLSYAQQRVWLEDRIAPGAAYNIPDALQFDEELDGVALARALHALVARHEILRTSFVEIEGEPRQIVHEQVEAEVEDVDLRTDPDWRDTTRRLIERAAATAFNLQAPPLLRALWIRQPDRRSLLALVMHHIISDAWSRNLLYGELSALYVGFRHDRLCDLEPLPIQYKDYAVWQTGQTFERERRYWHDVLAGAPTDVGLPYDRPPGPDRSFRGSRRSVRLAPEHAHAIRDLAGLRRTTVSNIMLAVFKLFLFELTGREEICVATAIANRDRPELEKLAGLLVNLLPIRTRLADDLDVGEVLLQVERAVYGAIEHGNYPFNLLIRDLRATGEEVLRPFLDVVYVYQTSGDVRLNVAHAARGVTPVEDEAPTFAFEFAKFDLSLFVTDEREGGLGLMLEYDSELFFDETVDRYLETLLDLSIGIGSLGR